MIYDLISADDEVHVTIVLEPLCNLVKLNSLQLCIIKNSAKFGKRFCPVFAR